MVSHSDDGIAMCHDRDVKQLSRQCGRVLFFLPHGIQPHCQMPRPLKIAVNLHPNNREKGSAAEPG
jgi:hypothetical protein